ncbi:DUF3592 domain-containing protein [Patescibacteria group bacterium]|nr:DUF3592 domain-containing protein [Patescibacteria group bacterium]
MTQIVPSFLASNKPLSGYQRWIIAPILLIGCLAVVVMGVRNIVTSIRVLRTWSAVEATVTNVYSRQRWYGVEYQYLAQGRSYTGSATQDRFFLRPSIGDRMTVRVDPKHSEVSDIPYFLPWIFWTPIAFGLALLAALLIKQR